MGTIKTTNIEPIADNGTVTLGSSGDTFTLGSGVTQTIANNTPYFFAYRNAALSISHATYTTIVYDAEDLDSGSGFNTSTGQYTVPEAGKYYFEYSIRSDSGSDTNSVRIFTYAQRTGSATTYWGEAALDFRANYGRGGSVGGSVILNCSANDVIENKIYHQTVNSGNVTIIVGDYRPTYFLGYKLIG